MKLKDREIKELEGIVKDWFWGKGFDTRGLIVETSVSSVSLEIRVGTVITPQPDGENGKQYPFLEMVTVLGLSRQQRKQLRSVGITSLVEFVDRTREKVLEIKYFGPLSLKKIENKLRSKGLKLRNR